MRTRAFLRGVGAMLLLAATGCSNKPEEKPLQIVQGGPSSPAIAWRESPEHAERAPISLTASDGTGLQLVALDARTVIEDPLAFTELHLTFRNPEPRRREGRFEITLPKEAAISRFAMRVGSELQEGEIVERRRAQQVYEDFLHRKQDPALLEKDAGNEFAARVFPIEANADKEIILSYSEELTRHDEPYRILLDGLPRLGKVAIDVRVGSNSATGQESTARSRNTSARLRLQETDFEPRGDVEVQLPWQRQVALRSGDLALARIAPVLTLPDEPIENLTVLLDTSASRALGFAAQIERLSALAAALEKRAGKPIELAVIAFDQTAEEIYRGPASAFGLREKSKLLERDALGASDLEQALAFLARAGGHSGRVLVITDGVVTAGATDTTALREATAKLAAHGVRRVDVLAEGGIQDRDTLTALTRAGLPNHGVVIDAGTGVAAIADKLWRGTRDRVEVRVSNASFVYPSTLEGVQAGDERLVYAVVPPQQPLQIELVGAGADAFETIEAPRPLLERALARAKIAALTGELRALRPEAEAERAAREREIVALSIAQRVVSDFTALLVLETDNDYARFGIAQNALTSILRIGDDGIELFDRNAGGDAPKPLRIARHDAPPIAAERQVDDETKTLLEGMLEAPTAEAPADKDTAAPSGVAAPAEGFASRRKGGGDVGAIRAQRSFEPSADAFAAAPAAKPAPAREQAPAKAEMAKRAATSERFAPPPPASVSAPAPASPRASLGTGAGIGDLGRRSRAESSAGAALDLAAEPERSTSGSGGSDDELRRRLPGALVVARPVEAAAEVRLRGAFGLPSAQASQALRALKPRARACYAQAAARADRRELVTLELSISDKGAVTDAFATGGATADPHVRTCVVAAARTLRFPKPEGANASVQAGVELFMQEASQPQLAATPRPAPRRPAPVPSPKIEDAYTGVLADVLSALQGGDKARALAAASAAHTADPGDVIALIALGEALEAQDDRARAARVYGSLIDLFPSRADLRRMASARLERLGAIGLPLAIDSYRHAVEQRPDHPSGPRALAYALVRLGERAEAFATLERALDRNYDPSRFEGVDRILREDLALVGAAWLRAEPDSEARVRAALATRGLDPDRAPSLRFVLSWETDANDVDFHIHDGRGSHAYYMKPKLAGGGALYADITTGYGPECFAIPGKARSYPYVLQAHYFARGPMGYGMGKLQVVEHDGKGGLAFEEHPFVIMKDKAFVELARLRGPLS